SRRSPPSCVGLSVGRSRLGRFARPRVLSLSVFPPVFLVYSRIVELDGLLEASQRPFTPTEPGVTEGASAIIAREIGDSVGSPRIDNRSQVSLSQSPRQQPARIFGA